MARSINTIQQQLIASKKSDTTLQKLTSPSQVAIWRSWTFIVATAINLLEQVIDIYKASIEASIQKGGVGTMPWLRERVLEFQAGDDAYYNSSTGKVKYNVVDTTKQIISRCSVTESSNRSVYVKIAAGNPPAPIGSTQLNQLKFYLNQLRFAGTQINVINANADKMQVWCDVYYDGQYADVIKTNVVASLNTYCLNLSSATNFNGVVINNDIIDTIRAVSGVKRVVLKKVIVTPDGGGDATVFDLSLGIDISEIETYSGYVIGSTATSKTFNDTINYIAV